MTVCCSMPKKTLMRSNALRYAVKTGQLKNRQEDWKVSWRPLADIAAYASVILLPIWALGLAFVFMLIVRRRYSVTAFVGVCALGMGDSYRGGRDRRVRHYDLRALLDVPCTDCEPSSSIRFHFDHRRRNYRLDAL